MEFDIVDKAEATIKRLKENHNVEKYLTNSQIRKFLSAVNNVKSKINAENMKAPNKKILSDAMAAEVKFLKVNIMYQACRDRSVKTFMNEAELEKIISEIGNDKNKFDNFCKYVEALVAFHKFYGGKD